MRKSKEKRIEEATALMEGYEAESLTADYRYRFISDMKARLLRGKSMSTKQRSWFDSLVEEGVPVIDTDKEKISAIKSALALRGMEHRQEPLQSFLSTLARGRSLSEKQEKFLNSMLNEADAVRENGPYSPEPDIVERLRDCVQLSKSYTTMYWSTHPGTYRSLQSVKLWLEDQDRHIDAWSVEKLLKAMRSKLDELHKNPYVVPGDFIWCHRSGEGLVPGVVVEPASISEKGQIVYGVLSGSEVVSVSRGSLSKRGRRS